MYNVLSQVTEIIFKVEIDTGYAMLWLKQLVVFC